MSEELERLRADVEVLGRYADDHIDIREAAKNAKFNLARLEAEADPWREAKEYFDGYKNYKSLSSDARQALAYVDHLTAKVEAQQKRVAELEAENKAWKEAASVWTVESEMINTPERLSDRIAELCGVKKIADMQPPFEGPIVGIEPVLDPARVLLTAIGILAGEREFKASASISDVMFRLGLSAAKPYPLKGDTEAKWQEMERTAWGQGS